MKQKQKTSLLTIKKQGIPKQNQPSVLRWHEQEKETYYHEQMTTLYDESILIQWEKNNKEIRVLYDDASKTSFMRPSKLALLKETQLFEAYFQKEPVAICFEDITNTIMKKIRETELHIEYKIQLLGNILFDHRQLVYIAKIHSIL